MIDNTMVRMTAGITTLVVVGAALALGTARQGPGDDLAAAGSPLYGIVVKESIRTLDQQQAGPGAAKSNVCPDCGQVHTPAVAAGEVCPDCGQVHAPAAAAGAGSPQDPIAGVHANAPALQPAARRRAPASVATPANALQNPVAPAVAGQPVTVPPQQPVAQKRFAHPAGGVCPDCGQIHPLPSAAAAGSANQAVPSGVPATSYYCPDCKTYHARPVAGQTPVVNPHTPPVQLAPSP